MNAEKNIRPLDQEEHDLADALEQLDVEALPALNIEQQRMLQEAAANFVGQEASMNISMNASELEEIRRRAARKGMQCQSFIREILHKYLTGQLAEKQVC